jgi:hypothetical protein
VQADWQKKKRKGKKKEKKYKKGNYCEVSGVLPRGWIVWIGRNAFYPSGE